MHALRSASVAEKGGVKMAGLKLRTHVHPGALELGWSADVDIRGRTGNLRVWLFYARCGHFCDGRLDDRLMHKGLCCLCARLKEFTCNICVFGL